MKPQTLFLILPFLWVGCQSPESAGNGNTQPIDTQPTATAEPTPTLLEKNAPFLDTASFAYFLSLHEQAESSQVGIAIPFYLMAKFLDPNMDTLKALGVEWTPEGEIWLRQGDTYEVEEGEFFVSSSYQYLHIFSTEGELLGDYAWEKQAHEGGEGEEQHSVMETVRDGYQLIRTSTFQRTGWLGEYGESELGVLEETKEVDTLLWDPVAQRFLTPTHP
ncbi:MAG TPA: hypothetical protein DCE41_22235 [Cytophagales bacterium]|nr:hypothetical protein [Cytophagales bacterium]HAP60535.1 hypothetical protein [Cytophagales bacterium]